MDTANVNVKLSEFAKVFFDGKPYDVPAELTIMTAMEYAGYRLVRGCGCRHGFCGACATIYRIEGKSPVHFALACQQKVEDGMYVATLPFFPLDRRTYDMEEITPDNQTMMQIFPEIFGCVACNSCTKSCSKGLNTMQYIAYAKRNDLKKCAETSFDCVSCGICSARCPANISHSLVGLLARRLSAKYLTPKSAHTHMRTKDIADGKFDDEINKIMRMPMDDIKKLYDTREIEK
ncbi:MAG: 2Fe-2S iron-sulfur cluster-binding protein [Defluviitaleaceae bacterium]|nr:2Fe-2S iron-sulfur cluster-binding protein [Defluviitaleaceae bacterium]